MINAGADLTFPYPEDMPLDGSWQLGMSESKKKKKPRKSGAKKAKKSFLRLTDFRDA